MQTDRGICQIKNLKTGKLLLTAEMNIVSARNRLEFAQKVDNCVSNKLMSNWKLYGKDAFSFEVLETLEKEETRSIEEY